MKLCKEKNDTPILVYSFIFFVGNPFKYPGSFNISNMCTEILNSYIWAVIEFFVGRWDWRRLCYSTNCLARSEYPATSRWRFSVSRPTVHQWERGAGAADAMTESYAAETGLSPATGRWLFQQWEHRTPRLESHAAWSGLQDCLLRPAAGGSLSGGQARLEPWSLVRPASVMADTVAAADATCCLYLYNSTYLYLVFNTKLFVKVN